MKTAHSGTAADKSQSDGVFRSIEKISRADAKTNINDGV
jgi:hypothetical protein